MEYVECIITFVSKNWTDILALLISLIALVVSIYSNHRKNILHRQEAQEPLYADVQQLLRCKCDCFSSVDKAMGCYMPDSSVGKSDEQVIRRKVERVFGKNAYKRLDRILRLCEEANSIDFDIGMLFSLIKETEPERYCKMQEILSEQDEHLTAQEQKNNQEFLSTISVSNYQITDQAPEESYDYLELISKLNSLDNEIRNERKSFENAIEKIMTKR